MLKGIPEILSPELLKVLCEMGHSDRLVIADGNFPVESMGKNAITIRCDGPWRSGDPGCHPEALPAGYLCKASGKPDGSNAWR